MRRLLILILGLACAMAAASTTPAAAKPRPGAPKPAAVTKALIAAQGATPFAAGKAAVRRARGALARKNLCAASTSLASHHAQVATRLRIANKRRAKAVARTLARADARGVKARRLVLRSLPVGKGCGGAPSVAVDASVKPQATMPEIGASGPRPVAAITDASGNTLDFVANELLVQGTEEQAQAIVKRWRGTILSVADLTQLGEKTKLYLIRIDTTKADDTRLSADLAALAKAHGGAASVSSEQGLDLLAAAGREARQTGTVGVNFISKGDSVAAGTSIEAPDGPAGYSTATPAWSSNAFTWKHLSANSTQGVGVPEAWQLLARTGRSQNKVGLAILDMGFSTVANAFDFGEPLTAISNVPTKSALETKNLAGCGSGNPCPYHGTNVANTAFSPLDNGHGVAGTGGPVAKRIVVFTYYDFFTSIAALVEARVAGARVVNMSYGAPVPYYLAWSVIPFELATRAASATGMVLIASAGNDNRNVDGTDCFLGACWEEAWVTPCENAGVMCVGALAEDSTERASYSNYGNESGGQVDIYAPGTVLVGPEPSTPQKWGPHGVHPVNGTSFAAPYLAGVAALVWAANPGLGAGSVESILKSSVKPSADKKVKRYGYVNALAAVSRTLPRLIHIEEPAAENSTFERGPAFRFSAFTHDPGGAQPTSITWTDGAGNVFGTGAAFNSAALPYGVSRVTATARYASGAAVSDSITLTITNSAPTVRITGPVGTRTFFPSETINFTGDATDTNQIETGGRLRPEQLGWFLDGAPTPFATGATAALPLAALSQDAHSVVFRGTDDAGVTRTDTFDFKVDPPPPNLPPSVVITSPTSNTLATQTGSDMTGIYGLFNFQATVSDPENDPLTYTWTEVVNFGSGPPAPPVVRSTVEDPGSQKLYFACNQSAHDWTLTVSDGHSTRSAKVSGLGINLVC